MYDVVVVGGGILGLASAYYIKELNQGLSVAVFEKEADVGQGNTSRSVGGFRQGIFTSRVNQMLAETTVRHYREVERGGEASLNMRYVGYLILMNQQRYRRASKTANEFVESGKAVLLKPEQLEKFFGMRTKFAGDEEAEMLNLQDVVAGLFAPECGILDVDKVVELYKRRCREVGVEIFTGRRVERLLLLPENPLGIPGEPRVWQRRRIAVSLEGGEVVDAGQVVVAAGSWCPELLDPLGIDCFVKPKKRQLFVIKPVDGLEELINLRWEGGRPLPMMFFPDGLYIAPRHEEKAFWVSLTDDVGRAFAHDYEPEPSYYYDNVHPLLRSYYPQFMNARPVNMWAGCYSMNNLDGNPLVFKVLNCVVVTGGSGSGVMKADAVGRIAEAVMTGKKYAVLHGGLKFDVEVVGVENRQVDKEYFIL
jgi:FAD-dependent oxidoreductase domain-containing protein 1